MVTAATVAPKSNGGGKSAAPMPVVGFVRAAQEHIEPFVDQTTQITTSAQVQGPFDVPAYGYLRHLYILVTTTGGSGGSAVAAEDSPFSALGDIQLSDVNGAPIFGPVSGYDLYLAQKYGGYDFNTDPRQSAAFSAVNATTGQFAFLLKLPVEICNRDGLGAIANQNASSTYKLRMTLSASTTIYTTPPATTLPSARIRCFLDAWTQPPASDFRGQPQATTPPAHGTSQYWSKYTVAAPVGNSTQRLARVGNAIREVIFVNRTAATSLRSTGETNFPDPLQIFWDTRLLHNYTKAVWRDVIRNRTGYNAAIETAGGPDNGVFVYDFCHEFDGKIGRELRDGYLPTVQSTRLEATGSWVAASNVDIITNDVAAAGDIYV